MTDAAQTIVMFTARAGMTRKNRRDPVKGAAVSCLAFSRWRVETCAGPREGSEPYLGAVPPSIRQRYRYPRCHPAESGQPGTAC
jgi:hypothetical protein